ncbi:hypothetical protein HF086_001062 [Spodoptera exigua]|uniref:Zinc finger PHD-type domain-containing protein n=1 Tax=Spodoptera exigua TaxID=7107 RepID=A0A922SB03_SPOEX|nr:hypothetical protein HF086_001062 [Spodoptera exigua]
MALKCAGCKQIVTKTDYLTCSLCNSIYDLECANIKNEHFKKMMVTETIESWICVACYCKIPKRGNINTPIRPQEHNSRQITSPLEINNVTIRRTMKPMNDTTTSLDLSLLGDTIGAQDEGTTLQSNTPTELTLQNIGEMIMLRLKENNEAIITKLRDTIQMELNKAITKLRQDFERETSSLQKQNEERKNDIQHIYKKIENLKTENEKLKAEIENLKTQTNTYQTNCSESYSKKIVLYGFEEYYKEPVNNLHIRLINLFREFMNVDLMGYIEEAYRIGKPSSKNRPLVIEILKVQDYDSNDSVADPTYLIPNQQENELSSITRLVTYQLDEVSTLQEPSTSNRSTTSTIPRPKSPATDTTSESLIVFPTTSSVRRIITYGQPRALIDQDQIELPQEM